ncbi:MAG: NUDIX hydrolase [Nanoarchaeota archaeon]
MKKLNYRKNVVSVLFDGKRILLVRKPNLNFWQFIQGGVETNESEEETVKREIIEETGIKVFKIIKRLNLFFKYDWNPELQKQKGFYFPTNEMIWFFAYQ